MIKNTRALNGGVSDRIQRIGKEFGLGDINKVRLPDNIIEKFYKADPELKRMRTRSNRSRQRPVQSQRPIQPPARSLPTTVDNPIVLDDSSDEEDEEYSTAPSSPIHASSELDLAQKGRMFYKFLYTQLQEEKAKVPTASSIKAAAKKARAYHDRQQDPRPDSHITHRTERKLEKERKKVQREVRRKEKIIPTPAPKASKQYVSQETQVRHVQTNRLNQQRREHIARDKTNEESDSNDGSDYIGLEKYSSNPRGRKVSRKSPRTIYPPRRSAAPPPPDVQRQPIQSGPSTPVQFTPPPPDVQRQPIQSGPSTFVQFKQPPQQYTPSQPIIARRRITPVLLQEYHTDHTTPTSSNDTEKKAVMGYKPVLQTLGVHIANNNAGPSQANNASQKPICPTELNGVNCVYPVCGYSHFRDFIQ